MDYLTQAHFVSKMIQLLLHVDNNDIHVRVSDIQDMKAPLLVKLEDVQQTHRLERMMGLIFLYTASYTVYV